MLFFGLGIAMCQQSDSAQDLRGWANAVWGSSHDQIKIAYPSAVMLEERHRITPPNQICDLRLTDFKIRDTTRRETYLSFNVNFCFTPQGALDQVVMVRYSNGPDNPGGAPLDAPVDETQAQFSAAETMLIEKYGAPAVKDHDEGIRKFFDRSVKLPKRRRTWRFRSSVVTLEMDCLLPFSHVVSVTYLRPPAENGF
jgi:hypothetical protein